MRLIKFITVIWLLGSIISGCAIKSDNSTEQIVIEYYEVYKKRQDINKLIEFYADDIVLEDIINGNIIHNKNNLKMFFDWDNSNFQMLDSTNLVILETIIHNNKAAIKGYFTKFRWGNIDFEPMHFTTILTFNKKNKIVKQVDWINYPSNLVDYGNRNNSNSWIK